MRKYRNIEYKQISQHKWRVSYVGKTNKVDTPINRKLKLPSARWDNPAIDYQRSKVYSAEDKIKVGIYKQSFSTSLSFVGLILSQKWFRDNFELYKIDIHDGYGHTHAKADRNEIVLPPWARSKLTILHELAHSCQTRLPHHGKQFCFIYLKLIKRYMGKRSYYKLIEYFESHNVKYK